MDTHIDYLECGEYGEHTLNEIQKLEGASKLVDIPALRDYLGSAVSAVDAELEKQGVKRSTVRVDRKDVEAKTSALRKEIEKFHHYLGALDDDITYDLEAFFPGGNRGSLSELKPADLAQKAGALIRGFSVDANKNLPDAAKRKTRLEAAHAALTAAVSGKGSSSGNAIQGTAALVAAREQFLVAYNGVAKRLVLAVLTELGRKDEYKLFFKDLQVNESQNPKAEPPPQ